VHVQPGGVAGDDADLPHLDAVRVLGR
jgi:hypothetical protein